MARDDALEITAGGTDAWVTGIGLVSSLGQGVEAHWQALAGAGSGQGVPRIDEQSFAPYPVHRLASIDFGEQIPNKTDLRQMGPWQSLGTFAAGLALADAGLMDRSVRAEIDLNTAAGNGERDAVADRLVLDALAAPSVTADTAGAILNENLQRSLRPTLYLGELSNLLAGNISIVHGVTGSSRTFKGEEMAGVSAIEDAVSRIGSGSSELFLVGGACNAERADLMLNLELCGAMWHGGHRPVWERAADGGGIVLGSLGVFLVVEAAAHAKARGRRPYARISTVASRRCDPASDPAALSRAADFLFSRVGRNLDKGALAVLSGASGVEPATSCERAWVDGLRERGFAPQVRAFGTALGHGLEAQFPAGVAMAAMALARGSLFAPFDESEPALPPVDTCERILVTTFGHWRGAGLALIEPAAAS